MMCYPKWLQICPPNLVPHITIVPSTVFRIVYRLSYEECTSDLAYRYVLLCLAS